MDRSSSSMPQISTSLTPRGGGPAGLVVGATYPFRALSFLLNHLQLWSYVVLPIIINIVVGGTLYGGLIWLGWHAIDDFVLGLPAWAKILSFVIQGVLLIALFIGTGLLLMQFGVILGSPFYGKLSEELEALRSGQRAVAEPFHPGAIARDLWRAIAFELKKLVLLIGLGLALFGCGFFPIIGPLITTVGGVILAATLVCLDFFDPPLERRRLRFREKLCIIARSFPSSAGFGLICLGLVSIPLVNLLAIPLCITAGTLFFCDRILQPTPH